MTGYAIKMTILITAMTVCIGLNTERVIGHQTGHPLQFRVSVFCSGDVLVVD